MFQALIMDVVDIGDIPRRGLNLPNLLFPKKLFQVAELLAKL
jgi:hypothetical protein